MKGTKEKLVLAAAELFAKKGYDETSVADISGLADANIASVNYHFGNKENLFFEVLDYCHKIVNEKYPLIKKDTVDAKGKLDFFVHNKLKRIFTSADTVYRILSNINPNSHLGEEVFNRYVKQDIEYMESIVAELSNNRLNAGELKLCVLNVMSVFKMFAATPHVKEKILKEFNGDGFRAAETIYPQTLRFVLAGIKACAGEGNV